MTDRETVSVAITGALYHLRLVESGDASAAYTRWSIARAQESIAYAQRVLSCQEWPRIKAERCGPCLRTSPAVCNCRYAVNSEE